MTIAGVIPALDEADRIGPAIEVIDIARPFEELEDILAEGVFHRGVLFGDMQRRRQRQSERPPRTGQPRPAKPQALSPPAVP